MERRPEWEKMSPWKSNAKRNVGPVGIAARSREWSFKESVAEPRWKTYDYVASGTKGVRGTQGVRTTRTARYP